MFNRTIDGCDTDGCGPDPDQAGFSLGSDGKAGGTGDGTDVASN